MLFKDLFRITRSGLFKWMSLQISPVQWTNFTVYWVGAKRRNGCLKMFLFNMKCSFDQAVSWLSSNHVRWTESITFFFFFQQDFKGYFPARSQISHISIQQNDSVLGFSRIYNNKNTIHLGFHPIDIMKTIYTVNSSMFSPLAYTFMPFSSTWQHPYKRLCGHPFCYWNELQCLILEKQKSVD